MVIVFSLVPSVKAAERQVIQPKINTGQQFNILPTATSTSTPPIQPRRIEIITLSPTPTSVIRQRAVLPITPTPTIAPTITLKPVNKTVEFKVKENALSLDGRKVENTDSSLKITLASVSAVLKAHEGFSELSFDVDGKKVDLPVRSDFIIKDNKLVLLDNGQELSLKFSPPSFYSALQSVLEQAKGELISIELKTENAKPYYFLRLKNAVKLFGFIPFEKEQLLKVDAQTNRPYYVKFSFLDKLSVLPDYAKLFDSGVSFEIQNVTFQPLSFKVGEKVVIRADLYNKGTESAYSGVGSHVKNWLYYKDVQIYGDNEEVLDIDPGESQKIVYVWDKIVCDAPISIIVDGGKKLKHMSTSKNAWYGTVKCAPDHGPDLVVTRIHFPDNGQVKVIGQKNKVEYTIKNIGDKDSIPVQALAREGNANFAALISVPLLKPGGIYFNNFNYTPTSCDPLQIEIDGQKKMVGLETNRDNNIGFEEAYVTNDCTLKPDLFFGLTYWLVDGYSFGKSHYPNGSYMNFKVDVINSNFQSCANFIKVGAYEDGKEIAKIDFGSLGQCWGGGTGGVSQQGLVRTKEFGLMSKCGSTLELKIDPENVVWETDETNNTWTRKIECQ